MKQHNINSGNCPLLNAMSALGNKWKPIIILVINTRTLRFGQIATRIHVISRKVLTDQLRELEEKGLILREEFKELPPRVEYSLTEKGLALLPILHMLEDWEKQYEIKKVLSEDESLSL
ncbi:MarR family transcriptional regulator [Elizabethkingia meningoseptica]|uniref:MarR family transcriptional regulator n=2 Tax=Elizabethkingia meningoseptica TaxID=238 RepID=A0A1T3H7A9_ELIME|nr:MULTISPECIES: helix-turn-helix domain-containing protein [Elizabethkingia]AQX05809.1 MarR family transcriptional regulator [Elizabethkingia meningoseptica]AQX13346.1 MarR family transcriptional regulator [Elizabethkingia meningoseptica]AQX47852.1 MarR family transcriptional regulator [Elizabethkingia meningoseptica]EJK5327767.1 helix-turn-helix transcriptional regulator [Elizabethkingia meningoseptica]KUY23041.1 MarR family transcriptional regulator [Elizabethkingia meningoseptica]